VILLTFAHRGEAKSFLKRAGYESLPGPVDGLYKGRDHLLLITGEGIQNATTKVAAVFGAYANQIDALVNLGLAGALLDDCQVGNIYPVRTCYLDRNGTMVFKSFDTSHTLDPEALDCVSVHHRILDAEEGQRLGCFASLVDREAWAIGSVCMLFNAPFSSYKLISDRVGEHNINLTESARDRSQEYSDKLYSFYQNLNISIKDPSRIIQRPSEDDFYFTSSQRRRYDSLMKSLLIKCSSQEEIFSLINLQEICHTELSRKQRTSQLLERLTDLLNPLNARVKEKLQHLSQPFRESGWRIGFDPHLQKESITIGANIHNKEELEKLIQALRALPYEELLAVLDGDIDV